MDDFHVQGDEDAARRYLPGDAENISQNGSFSDPVRAISCFSGGLSCCSTSNLVKRRRGGELARGKEPIKSP